MVRRIQKVPAKIEKKGKSGKEIQKELDQDILDEAELEEMDTKEAEVMRKAEDFTTIYDIEDDDQVDMTIMDQAESRKRWLWITAGVIAAIALVGVLLYALFFGTPKDTGAVTLTMKMDKAIASGDVVDIEITYVNNRKAAIQSGTLEVFYPDGFRFESSSVDSLEDDGKRFSLDRIEQGKGGKIRISGQLVGAKGDVKNISSQLSYRPENFSQQFQVDAKTKTTIESSIVSVEVEAPKQVKPGAEFEYKAKIKNTGENDLENVSIVLKHPEDFEVKESSEDFYARNDEWRYDLLEAGEEVELNLTLVLDGDSGVKDTLALEVGVVEEGNDINVQAEHENEIVLVDPKIDVALDMPDHAFPGDEITITAIVKNASGVDLKNVTPVLTLTGALFTESEKTFDTIKTWTADGEHTLKYTTTLKKLTKQEPVELKASLSIPAVSIAGAEIEIDSKTEEVLTVSGKPSIVAFGRYFDANLRAVGSGPIPPKVGQKTTYVIQLSVTAPQNALEDVTLTTTLPANVTWENKASTGVQYQASSRTVTWRASAIQATKTVGATFSVSVTPASSDKGSMMILTNELVFAADDAFTKETVNQTMSRITTDLSQDEGASGKGVVQ